jgi:hypothetical protein
MGLPRLQCWILETRKLIMFWAPKSEPAPTPARYQSGPPALTRWSALARAANACRASSTAA